MNAHVVSYEEMRNDLSGIFGNVISGGTVLVQEANQPIVAIIPFEDFLALKEQLEDLNDARTADAAYEEYLRDPSGARPLEELIAEWVAMDADQDNAAQ